jgi:Methyltransferase FkbM domain
MAWSSFSYQGQDLFVVDALNEQRGGFFLDSGASNGVRGNNTKLLESALGWTGICIEPNAQMFAELVRNRTCICLDCCLYDTDGTVEFLEAAQVYGGIIDEYHPFHLDYARRMARSFIGPDGQVSSTTKPARTIRSVLVDCGAPSVIDYWSLDTEGSELAILRSFPFDQYAFRVLTVEHNYLPAREKMRAFLESRSYHRVSSLGIDDCYVWDHAFSRGMWRSPVWRRSRRV